VVAAGLTDGTVRTPTARPPVGSGSSDGATAVVVCGVEVATAGERLEREVAWRLAVVVPHAEIMIVTAMPAAAALANLLVAFIFMPPFG
jgi:hypothetical protein